MAPESPPDRRRVGSLTPVDPKPGSSPQATLLAEPVRQTLLDGTTARAAPTRSAERADSDPESTMLRATRVDQDDGKFARGTMHIVPG